MIHFFSESANLLVCGDGENIEVRNNGNMMSSEQECGYLPFGLQWSIS